MKLTVHAVLSELELNNAVIDAAKRDAGQGVGSASVKILIEDGKATGAVVEFSKNGKG